MAETSERKTLSRNTLRACCRCITPVQKRCILSRNSHYILLEAALPIKQSCHWVQQAQALTRSRRIISRTYVSSCRSVAARTDIRADGETVRCQRSVRRRYHPLFPGCPSRSSASRLTVSTKAVQHMTTYWAILEKMKGSKLRLTKMDDEIYEHFKREFPEFDPRETIDEDHMKSKEGKERWRNFMMAYEKTVEDYNFGTMLRSNPKSEYGEKDTIFGWESSHPPSRL